MSDNYYVTGDYTQATWVPFDENYWLQGFSYFGNGTQYPSGALESIESTIMSYFISMEGFNSAGRVFIPAGTSKSGNAVFGATQYVTLSRTGDLTGSSSCT